MTYQLSAYAFRAMQMLPLDGGWYGLPRNNSKHLEAAIHQGLVVARNVAANCGVSRVIRYRLTVSGREFMQRRAA